MKKTWKVHIDDQYTFDVEKAEGEWQLEGAPVDLDLFALSAERISLIQDHKSLEAELVHLDRSTKEMQIRLDGQLYQVRIQDAMDLLLTSMGMDLDALAPTEPLRAPMPGKLLKIMVSPGQQIEKGDGLVVLEAMKMENVLKATGPGQVKAIPVVENAAVEKGAILVEFD